jgi:hypothetical protein
MNKTNKHTRNSSIKKRLARNGSQNCHIRDSDETRHSGAEFGYEKQQFEQEKKNTISMHSIYLLLAKEV